MIIEDLLQKVLHDRRVNDLIKEDGRLWNAVIEFAEKYHEQQVKSVDLADVGGSLLNDNTCNIKHDDSDEFYACDVTSCCGVGPIVREKYCPECGKRILRQ